MPCCAMFTMQLLLLFQLATFRFQLFDILFMLPFSIIRHEEFVARSSSSMRTLRDDASHHIGH